MSKNNFYVSYGIWIAILPFLGIPGTWRNALVFLSGIFLILVSLGPMILKKLQSKPRQKRRQKSYSGDLKFSETGIPSPLQRDSLDGASEGE